MSFTLQLSEQTDEDLLFQKKSGNKAILKKIISLLQEIVEHPYCRTGKSKPRKYELFGKWSRRINKVHRLVMKL